MLASVIANVNRDPKRRSKAWEPADFFDLPGATAERGPGDPMPPEQIEAAIRSFAAISKALTTTQQKKR